jgi:predicted peptidase
LMAPSEGILTAFVAMAVMTPLQVMAQQQETGFLVRSVTVRSETYRFQVYVPATYTSDREWPVILFLHGAGQRGTDGSRPTERELGTAIRKNSSRFPAIVVFPQARLGHGWDDAMQDQAIAALASSMKEFRGDPNRTYLTGVSMGGAGAWQLAAREAGRFAALVIIAGSVTYFPPGFQKEREVAFSQNDFLRAADPYRALAAKLKSVPIRLFHGSADMVVPASESRRMADALKGLQGDVEFKEYEGVPHNCWDQAYAEPELWTWLFSQHR